MWKITPTHPVRYSLRSFSNKQSKQSQFNLQINPLPPFFPLTLKWWNNFSLLADFSQTTIEHQISHFIWRRQMKQFVESLNLNTQTNTHTHTQKSSTGTRISIDTSRRPKRSSSTFALSEEASHRIEEKVFPGSQMLARFREGKISIQEEQW